MYSDVDLHVGHRIELPHDGHAGLTSDVDLHIGPSQELPRRGHAGLTSDVGLHVGHRLELPAVATQVSPLMLTSMLALAKSSPAVATQV